MHWNAGMLGLGSPGCQGGIASTGLTSLTTTTKKPPRTMLMLLQQPPRAQLSHHAQHPSAPPRKGATKALDFTPHAPPRLCRSLPGWQPSHPPFRGDMSLCFQSDLSLQHPSSIHYTSAMPPTLPAPTMPPRDGCSKSRSKLPIAHQGLQHPSRRTSRSPAPLPWTFQDK